MTADRFARHDLIPGWSQPRLADASVVVLGVGAIGNELARVLAQAGVGRLVLCDPDRVSKSNLSRTVLFRDRDVGRPKAEAAAAALAELAPGVRVDARVAPHANGVGLADLRDARLVVSCLDSRAARVQLAARCGLVGAGWLDAGTHPWGGEVRPYLDPDGPCYACTLTAAERATPDVPVSCTAPTPQAPEGASAPVSALVGGWLSLAAVRHLMGLPVPPETLRVDARLFQVRSVRIPRDPGCPCHGRLGAVTAVPVGSGDRVGDLRAALLPGEVPQVWEAVQERVECRGCGFREPRWGVPEAAACPRCGTALWPRTRLSLDTAPADLRLSALGIPPREILPVLSPGGGVRCVELRD